MRYDLQKILESMEQMHKTTRGNSFCMHGGECTLIPRGDFETILKKMYELQGQSAIQTNGYTINNDLIRLFKNYRTNVGVSIDGDGELNALRGFPDNPEKNRKYTDKVLANILKMKKEGIHVGIITVLHKVNASTTDKLEKLLKFILFLRSNDIKGGRLNLMWSNHPEAKQYQLTPEQASNAWLFLYENLKQYPDHHWQPFREFVDNLLGFAQSSCSLGKCDYFCTYGAKTILPDGTLGNCDRTHQEEHAYTRASDKPTYERYEILKQTDCKGCRYWNVCFGGCPAEGVDGDWRNKTRWCEPIYSLYEKVESDLKAMFPNINLVSDHNEIDDYFDMLRSGKSIQPFKKMSRDKAVNPSSWKGVKMKKQKEKAKVPINAHGDCAHGDHTDHGDSS